LRVPIQPLAAIRNKTTIHQHTPSARVVQCAAGSELFRGEVRFENRVELPSSQHFDVPEVTIMPISSYYYERNAYNYNNIHNVYSAVIMTVISRAHLVHLINVGWRQLAANSQTKPVNLGREPACRLP